MIDGLAVLREQEDVPFDAPHQELRDLVVLDERLPVMLIAPEREQIPTR